MSVTASLAVYLKRECSIIVQVPRHFFVSSSQLKTFPASHHTDEGFPHRILECHELISISLIFILQKVYSNFVTALFDWEITALLICEPTELKSDGKKVAISIKTLAEVRYLSCDQNSSNEVVPDPGKCVLVKR